MAADAAALSSRVADLALSLPEEASTHEDLAVFMLRQWNLDLTRAAGWMAKSIIRMCELEMKECWLVERSLMELVANQAVLNEHPPNALRFSMEEHNSNARIFDAMQRYNIGSPEERASKGAELTEVGALLRHHGLHPEDLDRSDARPFGKSVRQRFAAAGIVPHYEVHYLVASDYAHMNGRAVHHYLDRYYPDTAAAASIAITTEFLIRSLRMANEALGAGLAEEIEAIHAEYVGAVPSGADRREPD